LLLLLVVCSVLAVERTAQAPAFVLNQNESDIARATQHDWRIASDWFAGKKYAVLTFDDAPYGHGVDEKIMDILRKHHARAMFFVICNHLDATDPDVLDKLVRNGHVIGNHSYDHPQLTQLNAPELEHQIEGCSERISEITGRRPTYFRPPFGMTSPLVKHVAEEHGMRQVLWNANSRDSWQKKPSEILHWTVEETDDNSIVLMHDVPTTAMALDDTLTGLEERGFHFVLPDQMPSERFFD